MRILPSLAVSSLLLAPGPARSEEAPKALPTITERGASLQRFDGFVPILWDARQGQLLLVVEPGGGEFLYGVGLAGGAGILEAGLDRGQLGDLGLCRFERVGPRVLLRRLQTTHRAGSDNPEQRRVVAESFPSSILAAFPVVAEEGDRVLVDATAFVLEDRFVAAILKDADQGAWHQDRDRSAVDFGRTGAFPRNSEIEATLTFTTDAPPAAIADVLPDGRTMSLQVHHTFLALPEPGYRPRAYDPRIFFLPQRTLDHAASFDVRDRDVWRGVIAADVERRQLGGI